MNYRSPFQKRPVVVSMKARKSAKGKNCTLRLPCCNGNPETTVLAHLRFFGWAGISEKPSDYKAVYACSACHDAIDRRNNASTALWEFDDLMRARGETLDEMFSDGIMGFLK